MHLVFKGAADLHSTQPLYHYTACILGHVLFENLSPDLKNLAK